MYVAAENEWRTTVLAHSDLSAPSPCNPCLPTKVAQSVVQQSEGWRLSFPLFILSCKKKKKLTFRKFEKNLSLQKSFRNKTESTHMLLT